MWTFFFFYCPVQWYIFTVVFWTEMFQSFALEDNSNL